MTTYMSNILNVSNSKKAISFERDCDKSFTCAHREKPTMQNETSDREVLCRAFWYKLFLHRYKLILCV